MKASELKILLDNVTSSSDGTTDPEIVTGEVWLPERLIDVHEHQSYLFFEFDNAPEETQGEEEGRGFVEHEIEMIRHRFEQLLAEPTDTKTKADAMLALFLIAHESTSSDIIELLENPINELTQSNESPISE